MHVFQFDGIALCMPTRIVTVKVDTLLLKDVGCKVLRALNMYRKYRFYFLYYYIFGCTALWSNSEKDNPDCYQQMSANF